MPTPFDDLLTGTGGHNSGGHQQQQQQAGLDNITVGHDSMEALVEAPTVGLSGDGTVVVSLSAGARASEAPKQTGTPALKVPQKTEMNTAPTTAAAAFSPMAPTDKAVNRNQDKRTQSTPMPFEVQQLPPQPLPVVAQAMGVKMTEQARVHHPNDASLLPLMPIDFGDDMDIDKLRNDAVNCEATHQQQVKQEGPEPPVPGGLTALEPTSSSAVPATQPAAQQQQKSHTGKAVHPSTQTRSAPYNVTEKRQAQPAQATSSRMDKKRLAQQLLQILQQLLLHFLQQQVLQTLQLLAGVPNQSAYEQVWNQQQAMQWLQAAQQLLLVFPQSILLGMLVQRLHEELTAWGDHNVPWDALGLAPMDAEPQQGPQQAAVGIPQWQDLYEQYWSQQQATQVLQAAQQLLVIFPQQPFLAALVQRLQEELMAWGDNVPMDLLY